MHSVFFINHMEHMPSLKKVQASLPSSFAALNNCRQIWDCTEVHIEVPRSNLEAQRSTYSSYKGHNTFKVLISIAPNGTIIFASELYPGNTSDREIVIQCGILEKLERGELILADKGFLVSDLLPLGVTLNIPSFLNCESKQFTPNQIARNKLISTSRVHVERVIQRIKEYNILDCIPSHYRCIATMLFQLCSALVNLQRPVLQWNDEEWWL